MELPDFVELVNGRELRLTGHRIGVAHLVKLYRDGCSAEMIAAHFPTLALALIHRVIAWYLENQQQLDGYTDKTEIEMDQLEQITRAANPTPTTNDLRKRLETLRRAGHV